MIRIKAITSAAIATSTLTASGSPALAQIGGPVQEQTAGCSAVSGTSPRSQCGTPAQTGVLVNSVQGGYLSQDHRFFLTVQDDENVVLRFYQGGFDAGGSYSVLWNSKTYRNYRYAMRLEFQTDGNLVAYENNTGFAMWSSKTNGNPGATLTVQNDGNVTIKNSSGVVKWSTNTCCH